MRLDLDALIFDMDGTLVDSMPFHEKAWDVMLPELGVSIDRFEFFTWSAGLTNREIFPRLLKRDVTGEELAALADRKEAIYRDCYAPHMALMPGALEVIRRAEQGRVRVAMGTAAPPENVELVVDGLSVRHHFPVIVGGNDVANGKPDPEVFLKAAARMGVAPSRCLVFEDTPAGIEAAFRAGMHCVAITTTLTDLQVRALPNTSHLRAVVADYTDAALLSQLFQ
ncbi:MAG: HAD family phosphatase [Betaproteobacteria bacterium]|nr:MAG: HAD family phosphatase [Betaproteobacteria bacterium]